MIADYFSYEFIAVFMFVTMLLMLITGQRVFGAIGFVSAAAALLLWGDGAIEMPYTATWKLFKWYPMLTLPLFIYMGYMISESGIANDLYRMFHVYFGGVKGFSNWYHGNDGCYICNEWFECCWNGYWSHHSFT